MRIFVGGSLRDVQRDEPLCRAFVNALGVEVVKRGHVLLNGCRSSLDVEIARAAHAWITANGRDPAAQLVSYCLSGDTPAHDFGVVRNSALNDWQMNHPRLKVPEQIESADATLFVAGNEGTFWAKNWAHYARKPILGLPRFGGAGKEIYIQQLERWRDIAASAAEDYETLNQLTNDMPRYARDVVSLAERLVMPRSVFPAMPYQQSLRDVYDSYRETCKAFDLDLQERTDESAGTGRIIPRIETGLRNCAFVIADISDPPSPNVFFEVGFARALGKDVILTARRGTVLPFDVSDMPTLFWETQHELKEKLRTQLAGMRSRQGG